MRDYIFSRLLSIGSKTDDDASDVLFGGKDSILPPKEEEKKEEQDIKNKFSIKNWQLVSVKISNVGAYVYER